MDQQAAFSSDEMMAWIREMAAFGARRAGSPAGLANEDYLVAKLTEFGLANVRKEAIPVEYYQPDTSLVEIPIGGVQYPMAKLTVISRPKCMGCTPKAASIGKNTGPKINVAEMMRTKPRTAVKNRHMNTGT